MILPRLLALALLPLAAACASTEAEAPPPPPVEDPSAEPLVRVPPTGFEDCLEMLEPPARIEVELVMEVSDRGFVTDAKVVRSDDPCFNAASLRAVRQWRYGPKQRDGVLLARTGVRTILVYNFNDTSGEMGS